MANQWGADVLYRIISSDSLELTDEMLKEKKKLYYKYIFAKTENRMRKANIPSMYNTQ